MSFINFILFLIWIAVIAFGIAKTSNKFSRKKGLPILLIGVCGLIAQIILNFYLYYNFEVLWASQFNSSVFSKMFSTNVKLFLYSFIAAFIFTALNVTIGYFLIFKKFNKYFVISAVLISLIAGVIFGLFMRANISAEQYLLMQNGVPFGIKDPVLNIDSSFYIYKLPIINSIQNGVSFYLFFLSVAVFFYYSIVMGIKKDDWGLKNVVFFKVAKTHFLIIISLFLMSQVWAVIIEKWFLVANSSGARGIKYVMPALGFSKYVFIIGAILTIGLIFTKYNMKKTIIGSASIFLLSYVLLYTSTAIIPSIMQSTVIKTSEFAYEKKFIQYKIKMTRLSYGIDKIKTVKVKPGVFTRQTVVQNGPTFNNIRLHDYRAARDVLEQLQRFRPYYKFTPIRLDQYKINGQLRQVMISAREIDIDRLPENAATWINKHFVYTHGYGVVMFPVNEFSQSGEPLYAVKDIPVESKIGNFNPSIYYGTYTNEYVYVNTRQNEFDYPEGEQNKFTKYKGKTGININDHKFLIAWNTDGFRLYYTKELTKNSRLLYRRNIIQRVKELYPFLLHDKPYIAVVNGRLKWIIDAYTTAENFPYAALYRVRLPGQTRRKLDYFRNSVKIVIDAYDGTVKAYIVDKKCPIVKSWQKIFPNSFETGEIPPKLQEHFKFPPTEFELIAKVYSLYHVTDPQVFYNREDVYQISQELYYNVKNPYGPYYQICRLPGQSELKLNLMTMFIPAQTQIVRGLMGATLNMQTLESEIVFYSFPKTKARRDGIMQFLARIEQTPSIKEKLTLWGKRFMGNTLVYPLLEGAKFTLLYVQPVYIRSTNARFPQIKMIIVGDGASRISWGYTFNEAVNNLLSEEAAQTTEQRNQDRSSGRTPPVNVRQEVKKAFNDYLRALRENNFVKAGKALQKVKKLMQRL